MRPTRPLAPSVPRLCRLALAAGLVLALAGCGDDFLSYPEQVRGNKVDSDVVGQLVVGTSTKQDVTALLGSPTTKATFDDNSWLYISEVTHPVIAGTQGVDAQQVYVVKFDPKGVLASVTKKTLKDGLPVEMVDRTTPSPGTEASFLQQLLGNVGRFGTAPSLGNSNQGAQGSATNPGNF